LHYRAMQIYRRRKANIVSKKENMDRRRNVNLARFCRNTIKCEEIGGWGVTETVETNAMLYRSPPFNTSDRTLLKEKYVISSLHPSDDRTTKTSDDSMRLQGAENMGKAFPRSRIQKHFNTRT
jgi:hypothetical protein